MFSILTAAMLVMQSASFSSCLENTVCEMLILLWFLDLMEPLIKLNLSSLLELLSPIRECEILLMHCTTPMVAPDLDTMGTHRMDVVFIPDFLSISESK